MRCGRLIWLETWHLGRACWGGGAESSAYTQGSCLLPLGGSSSEGQAGRGGWGDSSWREGG